MTNSHIRFSTGTISTPNMNVFPEHRYNILGTHVNFRTKSGVIYIKKWCDLSNIDTEPGLSRISIRVRTYPSPGVIGHPSGLQYIRIFIYSQASSLDGSGILHLVTFTFFFAISLRFGLIRYLEKFWSLYLRFYVIRNYWPTASFLQNVPLTYNYEGL